MTLGLLLSLAFSALFSGTEIAFVSANKLRLELRKKKSPRSGQILNDFYQKSAQFLGTMLVGNNIALVIFTFLMEAMLYPWLSPMIPSGFGLFLVITLITTIVVLIFGEFLPKTLFRLSAENVLYVLAYPLYMIRLILFPVSWVMIWLSQRVLRFIMRTSIEETETALTRLDLENFVRSSRSSSAADENGDSSEDHTTDLFGKALSLADVRVRACMVHRTEIQSIDINASIEELERLFIESGFSRILVVEDEMDNVKGYVHHHFLLHQPKTIAEIVRPVPIIPGARFAADLLNQLIDKQLNIACVVDEYGGIAGLITQEDILEEVFGEFEDEHDQEDYIDQQYSATRFRFSGRLEIDFINEKYEVLNFPEGDYHTLSGYLVMTTGAIPEQGAEIEMDGYRFTLETVSDTKIETVVVRVLDTEA